MGAKKRATKKEALVCVTERTVRGTRGEESEGEILEEEGKQEHEASRGSLGSRTSSLTQIPEYSCTSCLHFNTSLLARVAPLFASSEFSRIFAALLSASMTRLTHSDATGPECSEREQYATLQPVIILLLPILTSNRQQWPNTADILPTRPAIRCSMPMRWLL